MCILTIYSKMKHKKSLLCISIALAIAPVAMTFAERNTSHIEVDDQASIDVAGDDWMSIEIGTTNEVTKDPAKGIDFDHVSPIAKGRNAIAIGTSAEAGNPH